MGIRVNVGGLDYEVSDYGVSEQSSPLSAGDSSGSVGSFSFDIPYPDPDLTPNHPIVRYGSDWLKGQEVKLSDTNYGFTLGSVDDVGDGEGVGITVTCLSRMGGLNVYNIQAQPFIGTLGDAFEYYLSRANVTTGFLVDSAIASTPVIFQGFNGELWYNLKQMASAMDCDISLVSGFILLRPIRQRTAERGRYIDQSGSTGDGTLAQAVEVYWYDTKPITDELVYPIGGWIPETEVLNVNSGETTEYQLELSASLSSFQTLTMQTFVASGYSSASVYTVVADDGLPVPVAQWNDNGGKVVVTLNEDTKSLTVTLTGANNIGLATGGTSSAFSLALASDESGSRYSTLRIVGTGVAFVKEKKRISTGVSAQQTATDVGETVDNPFLTDFNKLYSAGFRAAKRFTGVGMTISGSVSTVNRRGDKGILTKPTYSEVKAELVSALGAAPTNAQVKTYYLTPLSLSTYGDVSDYWVAETQDQFANQTFGNVQGARIWSEKKKRWYRIRDATLGPGDIGFGLAEDDLIYSDVQTFFSGLGYTYGDVQTAGSGLTYQQEGLVGLRA